MDKEYLNNFMITIEKPNGLPVLEMILNSVSDSYALYDGKAGEAILLYLLSRNLEYNHLTDIALMRLNDISDQIAQIESLSFSDGLAGIGWAIEWAAQNNFLEANTDEILEDIDDTLYKSVVYIPSENISLATGVLGKLLFFFARYKSRNLGSHRLKNIAHEECLVLLTDDLHEKLCGEDGHIYKGSVTNDDLINFGHAVYILSDFLWSKINEPTVEGTLYDLVKFIDTYLDGVVAREHYSNILLFLSCCYYLAGEYHHQSIWRNRGLHFTKAIAGAIPNANISTECDNSAFVNEMIIFSLGNLLSTGRETQSLPLFLSRGSKTFLNSLIESKLCDNHLIMPLLVVF